MPRDVHPISSGRLFTGAITVRWLAAIAWGIAGAAGAAEVLRVVPGGPAGPCTVDQWRADWPGCRYEDGVSEGRLSIVRDGATAAYRVDHAVGGIGPEQGGVGWRSPLAGAESVELGYTVRFSAGFDWVKGGKLPGLCGGPESVTGGRPANGTNGFSVRPMWRADGRGEAYVYHMHQPGRYGESFPFPDDVRFPTDVPVRLRIRVTLNKPGQRDGTLDLWVGLPGADERHVVTRSDVEWRSRPDILVDGLLFETFHGGGDRSWAPGRPCSTVFRDIVATTPDR